MEMIIYDTCTQPAHYSTGCNESGQNAAIKEQESHDMTIPKSNRSSPVLSNFEVLSIYISESPWQPRISPYKVTMKSLCFVFKAQSRGEAARP